MGRHRDFSCSASSCIVEMMKRDHTVFVLGAGFSVSASVPAMAGFLQRAREFYDAPNLPIPPYLQEHYDRVFDFRHKSKHCKDSISLDLENIESLFSLIDMADTLGLTDQSPVASVKHLIAHTVSRCQNISSMTVRLGMDPASMNNSRFADYWNARANHSGPMSYLEMSFYEAAVAILSGFFEPQSSGTERTFVTFNYDTVLEETLALLNGGAADYRTTHTPYKGARFTGTTPNYYVPILKLHGSINWAHVSVRNTRAHIFDDYNAFGEQYPPVLVPPTWKKGEISALSEEVWRGAYNSLKEATRICIIGFSMPETDPHFKHLIASALSENRGLYSLTVVDYNAPDDLKLRYQEFFRPLNEYRRYSYWDFGLWEFFRQLKFRDIGCGSFIKSIDRIA